MLYDWLLCAPLSHTLEQHGVRSSEEGLHGSLSVVI